MDKPESHQLDYTPLAGRTTGIYQLISLLASLYTWFISLLSNFQLLSSSLISSGNFLLISLKALPTDFLTYSLGSSFKATIRLIASFGLSLKYGLLVHILNPSVTALLVFGLSFSNHSSMLFHILYFCKIHQMPLLILPELSNYHL